MASSTKATPGEPDGARTSRNKPELRVPEELPFLAAISWFDQNYQSLNAQDMLSRYEAGWRHLGVLAEPSPQEERFIKALIERFGSVLHV